MTLGAYAREGGNMTHVDDTRDIDAALLARAYGEFVEMPGLQLTHAQASRLWNLQPALSALVLNRLVEASLLRRSGDAYVRADSGKRCA